MRVLLWDLRREGHHARWLSYLEKAAPAEADVVVSPPAFHAGAWPTPRREWQLLKFMVERERPDAVILASGHAVARRLAVSRLLRRLPWLVLDLRCSMAVLARPELFPGTSYRTRVGAHLSRASREVAVRRGAVAFGNLIPWAADVGSRELRRCSSGIPDPKESLELAHAGPRIDGRMTASLVGVLAPRKGLDLLAAAARLAPDLADRYAFRIAGQPSPDYVAEARRLVAGIRAAGFNVDATMRRLAAEEYEDVLATTDVVLLPYRSHLGSSGILGSVLETGRHRAVVSDYGWLGEVARTAGAVRFRDGDPASLASALRQAPLRPALCGPVEGFSSIADFARTVWELLPATIGGAD